MQTLYTTREVAIINQWCNESGNHDYAFYIVRRFYPIFGCIYRVLVGVNLFTGNHSDIRIVD